jgi:hypothetical protein
MKTRSLGVVVFAALFLSTPLLFGETSSCQHYAQGKFSGCIDFAVEKSTLPPPLQEICTMTGNGKWMENLPCPK